MKNKYGAVAVRAAIESGALVKRSVGRVRSISYKGRDNMVTDVDRASERIIIRNIRKAFPGHSVLTEEAGSIGKPSRFKWIIDPLDGTSNFAHGFPFFCVSIALEIDGDISLGVVYDPLREELFYAENGTGAFLNGLPISVSRTNKLSGSFLATGFSYGVKRKERNIGNFRRLLLSSLAIRRAGSAALDLCYVACGIFDGFWEMDLHPWDSAAGMLIVREAGGKVTRFDGARYNPYHKDILATNSFLHSRISQVLKFKI